jgi:hypothetical protein
MHGKTMTATLLAALLLLSLTPLLVAQGQAPSIRSSDIDKAFSFLSRGKDHIVIAESQMLKSVLTEFAKEQGITSGKITRSAFHTFARYLEEKKKNTGKPQEPKTASDTKKKEEDNLSPEEKLKQAAESSFKRMDDNDDKRLNRDEVNRSRIRNEFQKYDQNYDESISLDEYLIYFRNRYADRFNVKNYYGALVRVLVEEELVERPTLLRLGQLPGDLDWFAKLDTQPEDGQLSLYEWRLANEPIEEFLKRDRNDDGYLTPEEALFYQKQIEDADESMAEFYQFGSLENYPSLDPEASAENSDFPAARDE